MVATKRKAAKEGAKSASKGAKPGKEAKSTASGPPAPAARELIDMKEAIAILRTSRPTFYRWLRAGKVKGMKVGRQWRFYREDIERFLAGQEPRVDVPVGLDGLIGRLRERLDELDGAEIEEEGADDVQRVVNLMISLAYVMRASDVHVAPMLKPGSGVAVGTIRCRVDGVLHELADIDIRQLAAVVAQWKRKAACDVNDRARPQDGRILVDLPDDGGRLDLRVSFVPALFGESVTARLLFRAAASLALDRIDYHPTDRERIDRAIARPNGLVLVTGPTGCGKTTVMYACLNRIADGTRKIMTVEDPVEYALPWMVQIQVRPAHGLTFPVAMRSILRSDPDIIMVGEIRNRDTLQICFEAALTGHLLFSTLHTESAAGALTRMVDIGCEPFLVTDAVTLIVSQRLVRLLCPKCSVEADPSADQLKRAQDLARAGGLDWQSLSRGFRKPVGCPACVNTGYRGRTVIAETLEISPEIAVALRDGADTDALQAAAVRHGMTTMAADGIRRAAEGRTTIREVLRVLGASQRRPQG